MKDAEIIHHFHNTGLVFHHRSISKAGTDVSKITHLWSVALSIKTPNTLCCHQVLTPSTVMYRFFLLYVFSPQMVLWYTALWPRMIKGFRTSKYLNQNELYNYNFIYLNTKCLILLLPKVLTLSKCCLPLAIVLWYTCTIYEHVWPRVMVFLLLLFYDIHVPYMSMYDPGLWSSSYYCSMIYHIRPRMTRGYGAIKRKLTI